MRNSGKQVAKMATVGVDKATYDKLVDLRIDLDGIQIDLSLGNKIKFLMDFYEKAKRAVNTSTNTGYGSEL